MYSYPGWQGLLNLEYSNPHGKTLITKSEQLAPLKIQRPFYHQSPRICETMLLNTAGGIVGGDELNQNFHLNPNAEVIITTASAGKVYGSDQKKAFSTTNIILKSGAKLKFLPSENIIFNRAFYQQKLRIELSHDATWLGWEINRFGRSARGEIYQAGEWVSVTEIWRNNQPIWLDRQRLVGSESNFYSPNMLGGKPVVGTLSYWGNGVSPELVAKIRHLWYQIPRTADGGVTQLGGGLICRYRGYQTSEAIAWFSQIEKAL